MKRGTLGASDLEVDSPSPDDASLSLRSKAVRGSAWVIVGFGTQQVLSIGSNLVMTRLLFPEAFGLMALVFVFITGLAMFSDLGIRPSIVQSRRGDDPAFLRTAWTLQVARGALISLLAALIAVPVARFYGQPELATLLPIVALASLIAGFESTALPRLSRHLSLGRLTLLQLGAQVASIAVMVTWAMLQPTVWALVAGSLTGRLVTTAFSHVISRRRRDRFGWDRESFHELLGFGSWIFLSTVLTFFAGQADRLIFGKTIPVAMLGIYSIAWMFAELPIRLMEQIQGSVVFPAFSRKLGAAGPWEDFEQVYHRARLPVLVLAGLAIACLAASGPWLIAMLYDPRYADAGWIAQLLALGSWLFVLAGPSGSALLALGEPRWLALGNAAKIVGIALLVPIGFWLAGFPGAVFGFATTEALRYASITLGTHRLGLETWRRDLLVSILVGLAGVAGYAAATTLSARGLGNPASLATSLVTAAVLWLCFAGVLTRLGGQTLRAALRSLSS